MENNKVRKARGRPRAFNREEALEKAMLVFWEHGYEGTSMSDLTDALGITKPSIYEAFGSKEELFRKAVQNYQGSSTAFIAQALAAPTAYEAARTLLTGAATALTRCDQPRGCMVLQGVLNCGEEAETIRQDLIGWRRAYEEKLRERFEMARSAGEFAADTDIAALAKFVAMMHQGMSIQATGGATKDELLSAVAIALSQWPPGR